MYILLFLVVASTNAQENVLVSDSISLQIDSSEIQITRFRSDLSDEYSGREFIYEYKEPEKTAWDRFKEWLAFKISELFGLGTTEKSLSVVGTVVKVIAGLIVIFVVYLIVRAILKKEGMWIFGRDLSRKVVYHDDVALNLKATDFEKLVKETIDSGQLRLAIRFYYLWLLKTLSQRGTIQFDPDKTNSDYLHEIGNASQKDEFAYLSYLYNYIWYGAFDIDAATFEKAKNAFEKAIR